MTLDHESSFRASNGLCQRITTSGNKSSQSSNCDQYLDTKLQGPLHSRIMVEYRGVSRSPETSFSPITKMRELSPRTPLKWTNEEKK